MEENLRDIRACAKEVARDLASIGLVVNTDEIEFKTYTSFKTYGEAIITPGKNGEADHVTVRIIKDLLSEKVPYQAFKDTMAHELLHVIDGCNSHPMHNGNWLLLAQTVEKELPEYDVSVHESEDEWASYCKGDFNIILECPACKRKRRSIYPNKLTRHPDCNWRCPCGAMKPYVKVKDLYEEEKQGKTRAKR